MRKASLISEIVYLIEKNENLFQTKITIKDYQLKTPFSDAANPLMVNFIAFDSFEIITFNLKVLKFSRIASTNRLTLKLVFKPFALSRGPLHPSFKNLHRKWEKSPKVDTKMKYQSKRLSQL